MPDASGLVGNGAAINGIVTSSPGPSAFIYEFTVNTVFNVYGEVDGPFINFNNVANLALSPGSYFLELSNPQSSSWENNPKAPDSGYPLGVNLTVSAKSMSAPEIDPASAVTALTLLAGCLLVFRGRREAPAFRL